jgi:hypothetical protein
MHKRRYIVVGSTLWWASIAIFRCPKSPVVWQIALDEIDQAFESAWTVYLILAWGLLELGIVYGR